ncbi:helix-turn-helix transcriptional regulator [Paracoccus lutimaris]|uniref:AraC-like DNA-binding protein n=1 Tax=Paracoccus lutimaris TaxID=1490030 RepID=A0A368YNH0_9RHOB|nr:helix-turn-helix transcriptional regulator [Paracoccus lutimaris]RCW81771.1 AraC-like DNA-binding protein [Paracoccus lutimaris]
MSVIRFSTRDIDESLRKEMVDALYNDHVRTSVDFQAGGPAEVDIRLRTVAGVHLASANTTPVTLVTPADEDGLLYLSFAGGNGVHDARREDLIFRSGDVNVMRRDRGTVTTLAERCSCLSIAMPHSAILDRIASPDSLFQTRTLRDPASHLLFSYAVSLLHSEAVISDAEQAVYAGHLMDLAVLMLGAKGDSDEQARRNGGRAGRRRALKADIAAHLSDPCLTLGWLAKRHGVSVSYIRALFYEEGTSFTDHVTAARLDHVHGLLRDPRYRHHTIATIALMAGFGDISWFNQVFRRRFLATPSEIRDSFAAE